MQLTTQQRRRVEHAVAREIAALQVARTQRRGESGAAVQNASIVEHRQVAVPQLGVQMKSRNAQQRRECTIRGVERRQLACRQAQRRHRAIVVVDRPQLAARRKFDQRLLGIKLSVARAVVKRNRRPAQDCVPRRIGSLELAGECKAIGKDAVAPVGGRNQAVQRLEACTGSR